MLSGLHHVTIAVDGLDDSATAYTGLLGLEPVLRTDTGEASSVWFALDNVALELRASEAEPRGLVELGFATGSLEEAEERLRQHDLHPSRLELALTDRTTENGGHDLHRTLLRLAPARTGGVELRVESESDLPLSPAGLGDASRVSGLDHVVVRSRDPDAARSLYESGLGLRVALDREFEQWGVRLIFCRLAGLTVELASSLDSSGGSPLGAAPSASSRDDLWGLSWRVADADRAHARLAAEGFDVSDVRPGRKPGTRVFTVRDGTCGVPTLVIEPTAR